MNKDKNGNSIVFNESFICILLEYNLFKILFKLRMKVLRRYMPFCSYNCAEGRGNPRVFERQDITAACRGFLRAAVPRQLAGGAEGRGCSGSLYRGRRLELGGLPAH
jgi:hypothetical protein